MDNKIPRNFPDVSLQTLRSVVLIRDCKSAQAAANQAGVTISTLTRQISDLEEKLGVKLFDRLPRGMQPTTEGNSYAAAADRVFAELDRVKAEVDAERGEIRGHVRVFISEALVDDYLLREIHEIRKRHPRITVEATIAFAAQARTALLTQEADAATIFGMSRHDDIEILAKHEYPLIAVFGKDHPLAETELKEISAADLIANYAVAVPSRAYATRELFEKLLPKNPERRGASPEYSLVLNSLEHLRWYAIHGEAVAILPALSVRRELESEQLKFLHLTDAKAAHSNLSLCRHRQIAPNPAARLLLERLTVAFQNLTHNFVLP